MTQNKDTKLSETRRKRKSQRDGITEDFLLFLNSTDTKSFLAEDKQNDVYFIVKEYVKAFFDNIKLHIFKDEEANFKKASEIIRKLPAYYNYTPIYIRFIRRLFLRQRFIRVYLLGVTEDYIGRLINAGTKKKLRTKRNK